MSNPFSNYISAAKARGDNETARRLTVEGKILAHLVNYILKGGFLISVYDGEEYPIKKSSDKQAILAACGSTDEDILVIRNATGDKCGSIYLVYGNGNDVISDYTSNDLETFNDWLKPVEEYAEKVR